MKYANQTNTEDKMKYTRKTDLGTVKYFDGGSPASSSASFPFLARCEKMFLLICQQ